MNEQMMPTTLDAMSLANVGTYMLWGEINEEASYYACEFLIKANLLFDIGTPVTLFINSYGGDVSYGQAIIDVMSTSDIKIATRALGQIASMGTGIFITGTPGMRVMSSNCEVMTHQFSTTIYGKQHELIAARTAHDALEKRFIEHYMNHTKMDKETIEKVLLGPSDRYLSAAECLEYGICDAVMDPWDLTYNAGK